MLDTHAIARALTDARFTPEQADAITDAVRQAADHGDYVTSDQFEAGLAKLEVRIVRWLVGAALATAAVVVGAVAALLRFWLTGVSGP